MRQGAAAALRCVKQPLEEGEEGQALRGYVSNRGKSGPGRLGKQGEQTDVNVDGCETNGSKPFPFPSSVPTHVRTRQARTGRK